jgi:uncharacterized membrane protein YgdD (TMEM256/DUF423 family)
VTRVLVATGCLLAAAAVGTGAFGAHALRDNVSPERLIVFETACRYHMYHALAILFLAWASTFFTESERILRAAGAAFTMGVLFFSGSLYLYVLTEARWLVFLTPFGGVLLISGWILSAFLARRGTRGSS